MGSQQLYSLSWGEFGTSLTSTVQVLRGHGEMVDVTLAAGGRIFPAHKLVLSAASPLLMELLKSTHCHHPVVMLAGITAPDLEALLQFVYQGEVSVDPNQLPSLLQAAHCLDIQALSPQTLTTEKTMAQISVPMVINDGTNTSLPPMSRDQSMTSPLLPVRKRKRKQHRGSDTERDWGVGGVAVESQTMQSSPMQDPLANPGGDDPMKDEIIEEQHCNGEPAPPPPEGKLRCASEQPRLCPLCGLLIRQARNLRRHLLTACVSRPTLDHIDYLECQVSTPTSEPEEGRHFPPPSQYVASTPAVFQEQKLEELASTKKLVSDLPVECTICGVTLRQSRNLRRHMELIHLKIENGTKQRKTQVKDETKKPDEEPVQNMQSVQTLTEVVNPLEPQQPQGVPRDQSNAAGPSRMPPPPPNILTSPPMYHSSAQCDPYAQLQFTHQTSADVFRQHQQPDQHLLRNAGLYADTREQHCATE